MISAYFLIMGISHESITAFLIVSVLLGLTLLLNTKHPSYIYPLGYEYNRRVIIMRRIEGGLMLVFAAVVSYVAFA